MKKPRIEDILKPGAKFTTTIDRKDPKVIAFLKKVKKEQEKVLKSKKIDYEKLSRTFMTI